MSDLNERQPDERLDALIRRALRAESAEPEPLQTERMTRYWQSLDGQSFDRESLRESKGISSSHRLLPWMAAAVLLIAGGWLATYSLFSPSEPSQPTEVAQDQPLLEEDRIADSQSRPQETRELPEPTPKPPMQPKSAIAAKSPVSPDSSTSIGREPTELERLMFMARTKNRLPKVKKTMHEAIDGSLEKLVAHPEYDPRRFPALSDFATDKIEQELMDRFPLSTPEEQKAVLRLLAVYGSQNSLDKLIALTESDALRTEALAAIEAIAGIESWPMLNERVTSPAARQAISQRLIAALDANDPRIRTAATEAIGKSFDCGVTEKLIERVVRQPSQNEETWFALFACRCPQANAFLLDASQNPKLLGQFNHARLQWALKGIGDRG